MKRLSLLFTCFLLSVGLTIAQNTRVTGTVVDETGEPVIGAAVVVKGSPTIGTATNINGEFSLDVPSSAKTLVVRFLGMNNVEVAVAPTVFVEMLMSESLLDEVLIVAYGEAKKGTYTGSASVVNSTKTLKDLPVTNIESSLQGAAAGVYVGVPNGQPGAQAQIRIRGFGSYNASNDPLYVVDGVPVNSGDYALSGYGGSLGILNTLSPSDVENISVLKDAAATSMYGSRGANGVIMITTKKGKKGPLQVNLKGSWGFSDFAINNRPIASGDENWMLVNEGAYNQAIYNGMGEAEALAFAKEQADLIAPKRDSYSNWIDALTRTGKNESYELSMNGGNDNTSFYVSVGYVKDLGVYNDSYLDGFTSKASITHQSGNWRLNFDSNLAKIEQGVTPGIDDGYVAYANPYYASRTYLSPNIPIYNDDGSYYEGSMFTGNYYNLVADQKKNKATNSIARFMNTLGLSYEIIEGLRIKETFSFDYNDIGGISRYPSNSRDGSDFKGATSKQNYKSQRYYSSLMLTYDYEFMDAHSLALTAAWDVEEDKIEYLGAEGRKFASVNLWELSVAATPYGVYGYHDKDRMESYIGRLNYNYLEKYFFSGTFRRDGSSRFGENSKWGNFWSLSGSWKMKEENFLKDVSWVNDLKLRASYGVSGTRPSTLYSHLPTYSYSIAYGDNPASNPSRVANPDLSWEKNNVFDVGVEAYLFDRLSVELDYYDRQTNDMLLDAPISSITGFSTTLLNIGGMKNQGVEAALGVDIFKSEVKWKSQLNLGYNKNKVTKLYNGEPIISEVI